MLGLFRKKAADPKAALRELVGDYELPSFPQAVLQVLKTLRDPESTPSAIGHKVQVEPGLVVRVLKVVNSAAFGLSRPVEDIPHAVAMMGRARLEGLVLGIAVKDVLPRPRAAGYDAARFWRAAARRATVARSMAALIDPRTQAEAFTGALLQDMAVPVLAGVMPDRYGPVLSDWHAAEERRLEQLEAEAFGFDHTHAGGLMASIWGLPGNLVDAIGDHHEVDDSASAPAAVRLASHLRETDERPGVDRLVEVARGRFNLDADTVAGKIKDSFDQAADLVRLLS